MRRIPDSDIIGKSFGSWKAIRSNGVKKGQRHFMCLCSCGSERSVALSALRNGSSTRCVQCKMKYLQSEYGEFYSKNLSNWNKEHSGDKSLNWKGGRKIDGNGYILISNKTHPRSVHGYVREHTLVMEEMIGRYLFPGETVHHKNGIKDDNRSENLELWIGNHGSGSRVEDKIKDAIELLRLYAPQYLKEPQNG